ncbi:MAG: hypothetical protein NVS1B13_02330 [Flavisolibacter sp.]
MHLIVVADPAGKEELITGGVNPSLTINWIEKIQDINLDQKADAYLDLLFESSQSRINLLNALLPKPVIINSVVYNLKETNPSFIRINGWKTLLGKTMIEASGQEKGRGAVEELFQLLNKKIIWLPDETGFVTPKIIAMIINEAFRVLEDGISTKAQIDLAMKEGTSYPYGPFEWANKIGLHPVVKLLQKLSNTNTSYLTTQLMDKECRELPKELFE